MSVLTALARLEATRAGRAQRIADVRHCHSVERPMVMIPLRMAGETAAPLAVMLGFSEFEPQLLFVPQPRDRVLQLRFAAELAEVVLPYLSSFTAETEEIAGKDGESYQRCLDAPQFWVPNPGGIALLQKLGRRLRFLKPDGPNPLPESVPLLGRWLTYFGDRAEHPGSAMLLAMTTVLSGHWASGQSSLEDGNLAALLGWIDPPEGLTGQQAAAVAEDPLRSPPAGPATDPGYDNEELAPLISAFNDAVDEKAIDTALERLEQSVRSQLEPTWRLMWRGLGLLNALPEGASVAKRWDRDRGSFSRFMDSIEEGVPQARRDHAVSAVRRLLDREQALDALEAQRAYDDPRVMAERRLTGEAFRGVVVQSDPTRLDTSGKRPTLRPRIVVETSDPFNAEPGSKLCRVERPNQKGTVVSIEDGTIVLELSGGMGRKLVPEEGSVPEAGVQVCFAGFGDDYQAPPKLPAREETPWTHGGPPPEWTPETDEVREEWS
ncbi:hypothetical protein JK358_36390 [Nocardia sp. 2]|uniref:Uncharacterized protein n=1 Tax=Nocardia acididurans TaxID=2802282 RepID=A0ABS1MGU3_9NOCA|nr:hypothetical protein [Nocardia acididurans]MBL1079891.1 hypothetical protein [Nocardia acididurans]